MCLLDLTHTAGLHGRVNKQIARGYRAADLHVSRRGAPSRLVVAYLLMNGRAFFA